MKIITEIKQKAQYLKKKTQTNYKLQSRLDTSKNVSVNEMFCSKNEKKIISDIVNNVNVFAFKMLEKCVVGYIFETNMNYEIIITARDAQFMFLTRHYVHDVLMAVFTNTLTIMK